MSVPTPMLFVNHLMAYNHDVSQEVDQTFFLITDTDEVRRVVFFACGAPVPRGALDIVRMGTVVGNVFTILSIVSMMISGGDPDISMMFQSRRMKPAKDSLLLRGRGDRSGR